MNINRNNYEEYFILYMDNELSDEERRQVEIFVQENADLKAELIMLLQSKLIPDADINFKNKEMLMIKDLSVSITNYEEWLLSYIDNELTEEQRSNVERFVAANPIVQKEFNLLQQTKLQPEENIFSYKKSLYRREEKARIVSIRWWRIAAAAVLILGISTAMIILMNKKPVSDQGRVDIVKQTEEKPTNTPNVDQAIKETPDSGQVFDGNDRKEIKTPINNNNSVVKQKDIAERNKQSSAQEKKEETIIVKNNNEKKPGNNLPQPDNNPNIAIKVDENKAIVKNNTPSSTDHIKNTDNQIVTTTSPDTYNEGKTLAPADNPDIIYASNDGKKNKLRGFFRKVTRTFEKRTNIKATDDDDRLLIAGLTIKLN